MFLLIVLKVEQAGQYITEFSGTVRKIECITELFGTGHKTLSIPKLLRTGH